MKYPNYFLLFWFRVKFAFIDFTNNFSFIILHKLRLNLSNWIYNPIVKKLHLLICMEPVFPVLHNSQGCINWLCKLWKNDFTFFSSQLHFMTLPKPFCMVAQNFNIFLIFSFFRGMTDENSTWSKQVSRGMNIRTLQYYDKIGLLYHTKYTESGYRLYDDTALSVFQYFLQYL